jgi:2'-hydroxyisoflavone reductase
MGKSRRQFLKASVLGSAAVAASGLTKVAHSAQESNSKKTLEILILGGTGFIGPHMVREALRRGHSVTLFNRGRTNSGLFPDLETVKGDRGGNLDVLSGRHWDAVVDNSGYVPRHVQNSAQTLSNNIGHYLYISTISTYANHSEANDEDSPLATIEDESIEEVTGKTYGPLKVLCEKRAKEEIGGDRLTILRPTYICGPGDHTDRFSYWPVRASAGGEMLWPGSPSHPTQIIDVRDLANFVVDCLEQRIIGTYNTVTPVASYTMGDLLEDSQAITATTVNPVWVDEEFIDKYEVGEDGNLPIWHPLTGDNAAVSSVSGARARAAGLRNRPVRETVRDLIRWWKTLPEERTKQPRAGLSAQREAELIALWKKQHT